MITGLFRIGTFLASGYPIDLKNSELGDFILALKGLGQIEQY